MSNMVLVSVFDHAVLEFAPCMCVNSEAAAIRIFTNEVNRYDPNNLLSTNKSDFSLYVVGEFDLATGCVVNRDPRVLIHGRDILTVSLLIRLMAVLRLDNLGVRGLPPCYRLVAWVPVSMGIPFIRACFLFPGSVVLMLSCLSVNLTLRHSA